MNNVLKLEYSCEFDNLIEVMSEYMGKTYQEVETMAEKSYLMPENNKTFVTTQFGLNERHAKCPLRAALFNYMTETGIQDLYITHAI